MYRVGSWILCLLISATTAGAADDDPFRFRNPGASNARFVPLMALTAFSDDGRDVFKGNDRGPASIPPLQIPFSDTTDPAAPDPVAPPPVTPAFQPPEWVFRVQYQGEEQIGFPVGHTSFGAFRPFESDSGIRFVDGSFLLDNNGNLGGSVGIGIRRFNGSGTRILGVGGWYDIRQTQSDLVHQQLAATVRSLGEVWDFNLEVHVPTTDRVRGQGDPVLEAVQFQQNNLLADLSISQEVTMLGVDFDIARRISEDAFWGYAGVYHQQGGGEQVYGVRGGVRGFLTDDIRTHVEVTNDPVFETNVVFSLVYFFPIGQQRTPVRGSLADRLQRPLRRSSGIVVRNKRTRINGVVLEDADGNPIVVQHVNSNSAGGGTGTAEQPFNDLAAAQLASAPGDILLLHADSVFNGQSISLQDGQALLAETTPQQVMTRQIGSVPLPRATSGINRPLISNAPSDAITMASNTSVVGIDISNSVGNGIVSSGTSGQLLIQDNFIDSATNGIVLDQVETADVIGNSITNGSGFGIFAHNVNRLRIESNLLDNSNQGIGIFVDSGANTDALVGDNLVIAIDTSQPFLAFVSGSLGSRLGLNIFNNETNGQYQFQINPGDRLDLGGLLGTGNTFLNSDNGNLQNNQNTTLGGVPNTTVNGEINIVDPASIPIP